MLHCLSCKVTDFLLIRPHEKLFYRFITLFGLHRAIDNIIILHPDVPIQIIRTTAIVLFISIYHHHCDGSIHH